MRLSDFTFDLPEELIAHFPKEQRTDSRLLYLDAKGECHDQSFTDVIDSLDKGDVLVVNDTKVIPARLYGHKASGGKVEILLERVLSDQQILAQVKASKAPKPGIVLFIEGDDSACLTVLGRQENFFILEVSGVTDLYSWFDKVGKLPLPPYIKRQQRSGSLNEPNENTQELSENVLDESHDKERYQTVYAEHQGAVAAPTAGLHFDESLLQKIKDKGVYIATVTLHVGAGTYQPVRVDSIDDHIMHKERIIVGSEVCEHVNSAKQRGNKVIAVGTTVVRSLESAALAFSQLKTSEQNTSCIAPFEGETDIFIYPDFEFKVIDKLITNFHLSESTLLMLVSALNSRNAILAAYQHAIEQKYRFFSYGDAMLIERKTESI